MKRKLFGLVQAPGAKPKDNHQPVAGIASVTPSLEHQSPPTALECRSIVGGAMQKPVDGTRKDPALQQEDEAIAAKAAEHERRSAAARKAWITIRSNKVPAADGGASQPTSLVMPTGKASGASMATGPIHRIPPVFSAQSSDSVGKLFHECSGKAEIPTAESESIPDPAVVGKSDAKPNRKPPGVKAKENGTPLKRGAALQIMTYPRPATKAVLVRAAREHDQSLSSFLIRAGLEKAAIRKGCEVKDLLPPDELDQYL